MEPTRLVHISDIHITTREFRWFPEDWFNKRLPAWFNLRWLGREVFRFNNLPQRIKQVDEEIPMLVQRSSWQYGDAANTSYTATSGATSLTLRWTRSVKGSLASAPALSSRHWMALNAQTPGGCSLMEWENDDNGRQRWCTRLFQGGGISGPLFDGFDNLHPSSPLAQRANVRGVTIVTTDRIADPRRRPRRTSRNRSRGVTGRSSATCSGGSDSRPSGTRSVPRIVAQASRRCLHKAKQGTICALGTSAHAMAHLPGMAIRVFEQYGRDSRN